MIDLLIIGKDGQLGKAFVKASREQKLSFKAYSKDELDITKNLHVEKILKKIKPKIIINTSAFHVTALCEKKPLDAFKVNCIAVSNLAKLAKAVNARFVTYSTNYVFDGKKGQPYFENDIVNPLQMYGLSKLAGEMSALNEYPSGTYIIRTCGVYGGGYSGSKSKKGNYVLKILNEARTNEVIRASTKQIVNPTYAGDLAKYSISLLKLNPKPGIYHLASEGFCSWYDFAKKILEYKKINVKLIPFESNEENINFQSPLFSALQNSKAKKLGIVLPSIEDGLFKYLVEI